MTIADEKRKTDELLYEMLPKYVAEQLKQGKKVLMIMMMILIIIMTISYSSYFQTISTV